MSEKSLRMLPMKRNSLSTSDIPELSNLSSKANLVLLVEINKISKKADDVDDSGPYSRTPMRSPISNEREYKSRGQHSGASHRGRKNIFFDRATGPRFFKRILKIKPKSERKFKSTGKNWGF